MTSLYFFTVSTIASEPNLEAVDETVSLAKTASLPKTRRFFRPRKKVQRTVKPSVNPLKKLQLSIFNNRYIPIDPNPDKAYHLLPKRPMNLTAFTKHMMLIRKYEVMLKMEFQAASRNEIYTKHCTRHANKPNNELKNTYPKKSVPYDFNRVVLSQEPEGEEDSDYINASYVDSILKPNAYIAAQGPNEYTIHDFWRLVWEQQTFVIVMLTKVFDFIKVMCCQYWPMEEHKPEMYGKIEVTLLSEEHLADFVIRTIRIRKPGQMMKRKVKKTKLVPKNIANEAQSERIRMLEEDEDEEGLSAHISVDRFRESRRSKLSIHTARSRNASPRASLHTEHTRSSTRTRSTMKKTSFQASEKMFDEVEYEEEIEEEDVRVIYQLHYNNWSSHTCPFPNPILQFRRRVRIYMDEVIKDEGDRVGPTIVHCSDGCGRTGAYLCIDANLELSAEDGLYDVYGYSKRLKHSRRGLIENIEQYKFIYETLEEASICGKTYFPASELADKIKLKSHKNVFTQQNEYQLEYRKIAKMTRKPTIGECAGGHRIENREKNRDVAIVPPDNFRPYLTSFQSNEHTDYINAVFVDGYTRSKEYIITEWPIKKTLCDIWSLIYDHECNSVIVLGEPPLANGYPIFWPLDKHKKIKYGPVFTVEMVSSAHYPKIKTWIFRMNKKVVSLTELMAGVKAEPKTTQFFQITCWPLDHKVPTSTNALVELMNMVERWRQRTNYGPVVVVSYNGKSRAGVYCAANYAMEQVVQHGEVDIFSAVRTVRRHRSQLIENMTEYKYCYDLLFHYVTHYLNKDKNC